MQRPPRPVDLCTAAVDSVVLVVTSTHRLQHPRSLSKRHSDNSLPPLRIPAITHFPNTTKRHLNPSTLIDQGKVWSTESEWPGLLPSSQLGHLTPKSSIHHDPEPADRNWSHANNLAATRPLSCPPGYIWRIHLLNSFDHYIATCALG